MRLYPSQSTLMKRDLQMGGDRRIGAVLLGDPGPISDGRSPERIHAKPDPGAAHSFPVDTPVEIAYRIAYQA